MPKCAIDKFDLSKNTNLKYLNHTIFEIIPSTTLTLDKYPYTPNATPTPRVAPPCLLEEINEKCSMAALIISRDLSRRVITDNPTLIVLLNKQLR